jgi:succinate dehydrogenase / fumarate reductase, membrane anchor subunit
MKESSRPRPESGVELYAWVFMRLSGMLLLVLALVHLFFMHIVNNVDVIDFRFVAQRYATPFWRTFDLMMLWLALIHGLNGLRTVVIDYVRPRGWRFASLASIYVIGFIFLALGSLVILTFEPSKFALVR